MTKETSESLEVLLRKSLVPRASVLLALLALLALHAIAIPRSRHRASGKQVIEQIALRQWVHRATGVHDPLRSLFVDVMHSSKMLDHVVFAVEAVEVPIAVADWAWERQGRVVGLLVAGEVAL